MIKSIDVVSSSNIGKIAFEADEQSKEKGKLFVTFLNNSTYEYTDVPEEVFSKLSDVNLSGGSVGRAFIEMVKQGGFAYQKVEQPI